ncbi:hypothetical protein BGX31_000997 [Mortierella sp. GBA43]|nr:hypothetical protein BGX31_000997 [Mortierella sp. GBA43]
MTIIPKEELYGFPPEQFSRLKLHRQVYFQADVVSLCLDLTFTLGTDEFEASPFMDVHYIELEANQARKDEDGGKSVEINNSDISASGDYAATLYFTKGLGHLDVWDLKSNSGMDSASPRISTMPCAQATFPVPKGFSGHNPMTGTDVLMSISKFGSQVAICTAEESENGIPFQVFKWTPAAPVDHDPSRPWSLKRTLTICDSDFYNLFTYHYSDPSNTREEDERMCICDGFTISVYNTEGNWTQMYKVTMQDELNLMAVDDALDSLQGRYFAWVNMDGVISIWDFETGKVLSHILTGDKSASNPEISLDGSMIAVTASNTIHVYDTLTGIKLGVLREGLGQESDFDYVFGQDHLMISNVEESTVSKPYKHNIKSAVNVRSMSIVQNYEIHEDYNVKCLQGPKSLIFSYREGSSLSILQDMGHILSPTKEDDCGVDGVCERKSINIFSIFPDCNYALENANGEKFILGCSAPLVDGEFIREIDVTVDIDDVKEEDRPVMLVPAGLDYGDTSGFFIPATSQLVCLAENHLIIWTLSADGARVCELDTIWKVQDLPGSLPTDHIARQIDAAFVCEHGRDLRINLSKPKVYRPSLNYREIPCMGREETFTMPISAEDTVNSTEEYRNVQGIVYLMTIWGNGNAECGEAIVDYLKNRIRPSPKLPISSLETICRAWRLGNRNLVESIVDRLLPNDRITWVPDSKLTKEHDPLAIMLDHANENPIAVKVAKIIMNYCVVRANKSKNLAFLAPLFGSLYTVMDLFPEEALEHLGRIAYIPVKNRSFILDNHILVHEPKFRLQFWEPNVEPLSKTKNPIMQLHVTEDKPDETIKSFTRPVFSASFDALWHHKDAKLLGTSEEAKAEASDTVTTTWWKTLYLLIMLNLRLRTTTYVECYEFNIEFFDNPAIAALVAYKWNTIGYPFWAVRFISQCLFYALVIIAALMQVYFPEPSKLAGLFIAIIALSAIFLWLEVLQAVDNFSRYTKSRYNLIDIGAFSLTMAAAINQLVLIYQENPSGNTHSLSFAVLAVFLHMLFEMRVNESVCKYTTIIQETVYEIRVFFVIFAIGIVAFTIATLHLLRACPYETCEEPQTEFDGHILGALSATYFFMGGRWDPVSNEFSSHHWAFHLMMAIFFFFTVIIMLNVLIALINKAFEKGDDGWRLVWIESRLRYIESAENLSYHIPGFRQTYNYFPREIYFSATLQEVKEYREKYKPNLNGKDKEDDDELDIAEDWLEDITGEDGYQDEEPDDNEEDNDNGEDNGGNNGGNDGDEYEDMEDGDDEDDEDQAPSKSTKKKSQSGKKDGKKDAKGDKDTKKDAKKDKKAVLSKKKGRRVSVQAGWTTDEEGGYDDEDDGAGGRGTKSTKDNKTIRRLSTKIGDLHGQVGDLKSNIKDLQKQLSAQLAAQRQQSQRQRDEYQELRNLLTNLRS